MGDVLDAVSARIKAPYFGYAVLAFIALNWRAIFLFVMTEATPVERLAIFDAHTSNWTLFFAPLLVGVVVASIAAWVRLAFEHISKKPLEKITRLQLEAEHKKDIEKKRLAEEFSSKQDLLIDDAKKDLEIQNIEDDEVRQRLLKDIEKLRSERDEMMRSTRSPSLSPREQEILKAAAEDGHGLIAIREYLNGRSIQAGKTSLGSSEMKEFKLYKEALEWLERKGLVEQRGIEGSIYELTGRGWEVAHEIK